MGKRKSWLLLWVAVGLISGVADLGASTIFTSPGGGTVAFFGPPLEPLFAVDIPVDSIIGSGTPINDGVTANCIGCLMSWVTGSFLGSDPGIWYFDAGGSFAITGSVDFNGDMVPDLGPSTLVAGAFSSPVTVWETGGLLGFLADSKNSAIDAFFGATHTEGTLLLELVAPPGSAPGPILTSATSGFLVNSTPIPEPSTYALTFVGLVGLAISARRARRAKR